MLISTLYNGQSITPSQQADPVVPWWSFTKTVLAAAALTLVRDGRLHLDASLPEQAFTLRQLLRHEAGLADYGELPEYHDAVANHEPAWPADEMMLGRRIAMGADVADLEPAGATRMLVSRVRQG